MKEKDAGRLREEYERLVNGLAESGTLPLNAELMSNPVLPEEILHQAVPGNLRRADNFVKYMRKLVHFLKGRMQVNEVVMESPTAFLHKLDNEGLLHNKCGGKFYFWVQIHSWNVKNSIPKEDEAPRHESQRRRPLRGAHETIQPRRGEHAPRHESRRRRPLRGE